MKKIDLKSLPPKWWAVSLVFTCGNSRVLNTLTTVARTEEEAIKSALGSSEVINTIFIGATLNMKSAVQFKVEPSAEDVKEFYEWAQDDVEQ